MAKQVIALLCEGVHDVEFLSRILKSDSFTSNGKLKIKDYPSPINELLKGEVTRTNVDDLNLNVVREVLLPVATLQKTDTYFLLYALGGDKKKEMRKKILCNFWSLIPKSGEISALSDDLSLGIVYFFDSDNEGVDVRISELNDEINEVLKINLSLSHKDTRNYLGLKLGAYIFTGNNNNKGKLEDILIPLMKSGNEVVFDEAVGYLEKNFDEQKIASKSKYDKDKSLIGIVGQLQISGASNTVCIKKSDYLNDKKIKSNNKCIEIIQYINSLI